jgi:4-hydroxybenzoate polyprenyltransferase
MVNRDGGGPVRRDAPAGYRMLRGIVRTLRPHQWMKNSFVLAPLVFSRHLGERELTLRAVGATLVFCLLSGSVYAINDVLYVEKDRAHPTKRNRPVASGLVPPRVASAVAVGLIALSIGTAPLLGVGFSIVASAYLLQNLAYSAVLKEIVFVDVLSIAFGFVLRVLGGSLAAGVEPSVWLLACTFLLALFLALCKRRHEKILTRETGGEHRPSLEQYDIRLLDQLIGITGSSTIVCYAMYTLAPGTVDKFGTRMLGFTVPFVVFGIFRYLDLVYRHAKGDRPERILLTDLPILADLILYGLSVGLIFWLGR